MEGLGKGCEQVDKMGRWMMFVREELEVARRKQTKALLGGTPFLLLNCPPTLLS